MNKLCKRFSSCIFLFLCFLSPFISAQKKIAGEKIASSEIERYKQDAGRLVSFLEYSMNIIGSDSSTVEEKEAVIYSSYLKIYKDKKVIIEDDLDENRKTATYKAVQSYLQDIAYFYKRVHFILDVENIEYAESDSHAFYFKITLTRHLKGINLYEDTIKNSEHRYIEMNIDPKNRELKVASVYTTKPDEKKDILQWWAQLPEEWKKVLRKESGIVDSIQYEQLAKIIALETINLADNQSITDFSPLSRLTELKQIDLSHTVISNLDVLRNLIQLETLKLNDTPLLVIPPLTYLHKLTYIDISNTGIASLEFVKSFPNLHKLYCAGTLITDFSPLSGLKFLEELNCSNTGIQDLSAISKCKGLTKLDVSDTKIGSAQQLSTLSNLKSLNLSNTLVSSLKPLTGIITLKTIYCDKTGIHKESTLEFMQKHKNTLVIYESEGLSNWWSSMSPEWKKVFRQGRQLEDIPTREQLATLVNIDSIDISGNQKLSDLMPLQLLSNLKTLRLSHTAVATLQPLADIISLQKIDFSSTGIRDLDYLRKLKRLSLLICNNTPLDSLTIANFIKDNKNCLVVYKSDELNKWWAQLSNEWKAVFRLYTRLDAPPTEQQLQRLINLDSISIRGNNFMSWTPLNEFSYLRYLGLPNCMIPVLPNLSAFKQLSVLDISDNPLIDLVPIENNTALRNLNCSNTAIRNLNPLQNLNHLEVLKCSGTRIRDLKPISNLFNLKLLDISNTLVKKMASLENLNKLKTLVCYNTLISSKGIGNFKHSHPSCTLTYF